jgi:hypothetical protein
MPYDIRIGAAKGAKNLAAGGVAAAIALFLNAGSFIVGSCPEVAGYVVVEAITIKTIWDIVANYLKHNTPEPAT